MSYKFRTSIILSSIFSLAFIFIKLVNALGSDDCTSKWRLVYHNVHQEKCYALESPTCKKQEPLPGGYPKCLTQPNCLSATELIQVKEEQCFDQENLACEVSIIEKDPSLNLCPKPACYSVLPASSCQKDELAQSIKFIGQDDPRCQEGKNMPSDKGYCACKAFSDEDLSLKSYLALSGGKSCDMTSAEGPLYIQPEVKTLTPFCQNYEINIQRVCRGAPKINKVYLDGNPSLNYGPPGSEIIIEGLNLGNTTKVEVGGQPSEILSASDNQVKAKIYKDPAGNNSHICANSVVLTNRDTQTRINDLLDSTATDIPIERSAEGYFIVADKKVSAAELDKDADTPYYGRISFSPTKGLFGTVLIIENDKKILGGLANKSWVTFAGEQEIAAEFYNAESSYWQSDKIRVKVPRGLKIEIEGRIRVHLCDPEQKRDVYLETTDDFKLIDPVDATPAELSELKPKIAYFTPNFGVNRRQWQIEKDPYNLEYQEEVSLFGRNFDQVSNVSMIDKYGAELAVGFEVKSPFFSWNSYEVKTLVPFDATSGKVSLYIWDGSLGYQTNELNFQVKPVVQKVLPNRGSAEQIITILGSDFCEIDSCFDLPEVYLSFYQDLGLSGIKAKQLLSFNHRQIQFKLDRGEEDDYDRVEANGGKIDAQAAVYSGLLYVKRADGVLSRPYQTETRGHFGSFFERAPNFFTKLPLLKSITPNTVFAKQDTKILLKGENFYGTANLLPELHDYAYGSYPKTKIWNYFLENLDKETKKDYLVHQGVNPASGPEIQSLEMQELVSTHILSPFSQKSGIINRHSVLGINYDGSFAMFFKSNAPRADLRPIMSYEIDDERFQLKSGRSYYGYWSYGRQQIPKVNLQASNVIPLEFKIKNPDILREDSEEKAEIEFRVNKGWFQKIYKDDRISITQTLPMLNQLGIFDVSAESDELSGEVDFAFSFFNGIERYYQCNYLEAPAGEEKVAVCNSEPYFPGVLPQGQSALASYGFFQTNQFVIDCAPPKIKNISVISNSKIKVSGENLNNVAVTINGKGYKSGYTSGVLSVSLSKKLPTGVYVLRVQSKDRCATAARYNEKNFKVN